jgi:hypothetical protein
VNRRLYWRFGGIRALRRTPEGYADFERVTLEGPYLAAGDSCEEAAMTQPDPTPPKPGYREATADPASVLVCQRCGALVSDTETDLHDRFQVSVERPATMPSTTTRS